VNMSRSGRKRLSVDVPIWLHDKIKASAKKRNCTITKWVLRALSAKILEENKHNN